jgi:hypothetical protein
MFKIIYKQVIASTINTVIALVLTLLASTPQHLAVMLPPLPLPPSLLQKCPIHLPLPENATVKATLNNAVAVEDTYRACRDNNNDLVNLIEKRQKRSIDWSQ